MKLQIATAALVISTLVLLIQYVNQKERRHDQLVTLRSDFLTRISSAQQRLTSITMQAETLRVELRSMRDSEDKYDSIEQMPTILGRMRSISEQLKKLKTGVESLDTREENRSDVLLRFQSVTHDVKTLDNNVDGIESKILDLIAKVRANQTSDQLDGQQPPERDK